MAEFIDNLKLPLSNRNINNLMLINNETFFRYIFERHSDKTVTRPIKMITNAFIFQTGSAHIRARVRLKMSRRNSKK